MRSLILAATATLAVLSGIYFYTNQAQSPSRLLTKPVYSEAMLSAWTQWKMTNGKTYGVSTEEEYRRSVFMVNFHKVNNHNSTEGKTWTMALNKFADLTSDEFRATYTGLNHSVESKRPKNYVNHNVETTPSAQDWRGRGVSEVKDQGRCGSCWSFSTTGAVEGAYYRSHGTVVSMSEQQLVDCAGTNWGNNGCSGGLMDHAFQYVEMYGLMRESDYPYTANDSNTCRFDAARMVTKVRVFTDIARDSQPQLKAGLAGQTVSVAINANPLQLYHSGVFSDWSGCPANLDHGVLAVGYGHDDGKDHWIVKNSWGGNWGESGYFRMERRDYGEGICGITKNASYPTV